VSAHDMEQVAKALKSLESKQVRILTGVVQGNSENPQITQVLLDNDSGGSAEGAPVTIPSICGILPSGARVSVLTVPPAGMIIVGVIGTTTVLGALGSGFSATLPAFSLLLRSRNLLWIVRRFYTASNTWTKPDSPLFMGVMVRAQSGGGGSGGTEVCTSQSVASGGGQGGGYIEGYTVDGLLEATAAITVGAGGTAAAAGNNNGGIGGASSFDSGAGTTLLTIPGGAGGIGGAAAAAGQTTSLGGASNQGASATAANFDVVDLCNGDDGGTGWRTVFGDAGLIVPGYGGGSRMGSMTQVAGLTTNGAVDNKQIAPTVGWLFGGGASGRGVNDYAGGAGVAAGGGAAGAQGCVVVDEIYRA
jgi:hypothetical protein